MAKFLPSEIARLVLGYLQEQGCMTAYEELLRKCPHLWECRGRKFSTALIGFTLTTILDEHCSSHYLLYKCESLRQSLRLYRTLPQKFEFLVKLAGSRLEPREQDSSSDTKSRSFEFRREPFSSLQLSPTEKTRGEEDFLTLERIDDCSSGDKQIQSEPIFEALMSKPSMENASLQETWATNESPTETIPLQDDAAHGMHVPAIETQETVPPATAKHQIKIPVPVADAMDGLHHSGEAGALRLTSSSHTPTQNLFMCDVCLKGFKQKYKLVGHLKTHDRKKQYSSAVVFGDISNLKKHFKTVNKSNTSEKSYICKQCNAGFHKNYKLKVHLRTHSGEKPYVCEHCNAAFSQNGNLKIHLRTHSGVKPYVCNHCNAGFYQNYKLKLHLKTHNGIKPYICDHCNAGFSRSDYLKVHLRKHTGEKPYVCEHCNAGFSCNGDLKKHLKTHTSVKPYVCDHCNAAFSKNGNLKIHLRTHSGVKPYVCNHCNAGFYQNYKLKLHLKTHNGIKPYICDHCNAGFSRSDYLKVHLRKHTGEKPYICDHCNAAFSKNGNLKRHLRTHSGVKPFVCEHCNAGFHQNGNLKIHLRTHSGVKPYVCEHCNAGFTRYDHLKAHLRKHTGLKPCI